MRASRLHLPTLREPPKDAETISHQLLVRSGYIRRVAAGIYSFLPLGVRAVEKVKQVVREEMNRAGALEVFLPAVIPAELWQESGRWSQYGPELLRVKDRKQADYCIGPTHEEVIVDLVRKDVRSYRQLPLNLYQIQTKFRDEMRPRAGLMRGREFVMKDAYSFDATVDGAHASYRGMYDAYARTFQRLGLEFRAVEADTGAIGGTMSHEFQVLADSGEDAIVACEACTYAANVEKCTLAPLPHAEIPRDAEPLRVVDTPGAKSIEAVCQMLGCAPQAMVKAVLFMATYEADGPILPAVAFVRGDRDVNEVKVKAAFGAVTLHLADAEWFAKATGLPPGYVGPHAIGELVANRGFAGFRFALDHEIAAMPVAVCGANSKQQHLADVRPVRDFAGAAYTDLRMAVPGDPCPRCGGKLRGFRGIEVGHVFYLGQKYSKAMSATFLAEDGSERPFEMGCYGIGITRILSAAIEQNHDERGIRWPVALAPFEVAVLPLQSEGVQADVAVQIEAELEAAGSETVRDDRDERPGVKFNDADLIGYPLQIVCGRKAQDGVVEVKVRATGERFEAKVTGLANRVAAAIQAARTGAKLDTTGLAG
jgi:prolyl-tRNA synthetase